MVSESMCEEAEEGQPGFSDHEKRRTPSHHKYLKVRTVAETGNF